jgi:hypothetical protein
VTELSRLASQSGNMTQKKRGQIDETHATTKLAVAAIADIQMTI